MKKQLHLDTAAEKEAIDLGRQFMNSSDVVGDMSRAYGADLSAVRLHTDDGAAQKTAERGVDAFSTGRDVFFGKGIFDKNDPASRGLLAHELSHSLQQGVGGDVGGMQHSAPMGAEQGGILSWFKGLFGKKKEMQISEPLSMERNTDAKSVEYMSQMRDILHNGKFQQKDATGRPVNFMSAESQELGNLVAGMSDDELRGNEDVRQRILDDYKSSMSNRMGLWEHDSYDSMFSSVFRSNSTGELQTYKRLLAVHSGPFAEQIMPMIQGTRETDGSGMNWGTVDSALDAAGESIAADPVMMQILDAGMEGFGDSSHFSGEHEDRKSEMLMNTLALRGITPALTNTKTAQGITAGWAVQKAVNQNDLQTEGGRRFLGLLSRLKRK